MAPLPRPFELERQLARLARIIAAPAPRPLAEQLLTIPQPFRAAEGAGADNRQMQPPCRSGAYRLGLRDGMLWTWGVVILIALLALVVLW